MNETTTHQKQLMMLRYEAPVPDAPLHPGWTLRSMKPGEGAVWAQITEEGGYFSAGMEPQQRWMTTMGQDPGVLPENVFFVCDETGRPAASATARLLTPAELQKYPPSPAGLGYLHFVTTLPRCRGKGAGRAVTAAVLKRFSGLGTPDCVLNTDDHRLAAIRLYLRMGWLPVLSAPDMAERWRQVFSSLGRTGEVTVLDMSGQPVSLAIPD